MNKKNLNPIFWLFIVIIFFASCQQEQKKFTLQANIKNATGKYLKIMDMTNIGFPTDSIALNKENLFVYEKNIHQPADFVLYFVPEQSIRITPLPNEKIILSGNAEKLIESYQLKGSEASEVISHYAKYLHHLKAELDSVRSFYEQNQEAENIRHIIEIAKKRSDSIFNLGKNYLQKVIKNNPSGMESYVALSQKMNARLNFFTLQKDIDYFTMVDTAFSRAYDTAKVAVMLHNYVQKAKQIDRKKETTKQLNIGEIVPDIQLPNINGDTLALSELKGKYVLVDFWGSWCYPCREEHKNLRKTYWKFRKLGFEIFQIALEYDKENWKNTLKEDKLWWKYQVSELNYMDSKIAKIYKIKKVPSNFLIDGERKIVAKNLYGENLQKELENLLIKK